MRVTRSTIAGLAGLGLMLLSRAAHAQSAQESFDRLFKDEAQRVAATTDRKDDALFAAKLFDAAGSLRDAPELRVLLLTKAAEFGMRSGEGQATALSALDSLAALQPLLAGDFLERSLSIYSAQFRQAKREERPQAGERLLERVLLVAQKRTEQGRHADAFRLYSDALGTANEIRWPRVPELRLLMRQAQARRETAERREALEKRLANGAKDSPAAVELAQLLLVEVDDPAAAAAVAAQSEDKSLATLTALAARPLDELVADQCRAVAEGYEKLALRATAAGQPLALKHAAEAYEKFLTLYTKEDPQRLQAKLAGERIAKALGAFTPAPAADAPRSPERPAGTPVRPQANVDASPRGAPVEEVLRMAPLPLVVGAEKQEEHFKAPGWREVPEALLGAAIFSGDMGGHSGVADFTVVANGRIAVACNWDYEGNNSGGWTEDRWSLQQFNANGWKAVAEMVSESNRKYTVLAKDVHAGQHYRLRSNKYGPPMVVVLPPGRKFPMELARRRLIDPAPYPALAAQAASGEVFYRGMLGAYTSRGNPTAYAALAVPDGKSHLSEEVLSKMKSVNDPATLGFQARARLLVPRDGAYRIDAGRASKVAIDGVKREIDNYGRRNAADVNLKQGVHEITLEVGNNGSQLAETSLTITDNATGEELPLVISEKEIASFLKAPGGGTDLQEVVSWDRASSRWTLGAPK